MIAFISLLSFDLDLDHDLESVHSAEKHHFHRQPLSHADQKFEEFPDYASGGIVIASVDEALRDLAYMVGYHNNRCNQAVADDRLPPKGDSSESSHPHEVGKLSGAKAEK